MMNPKKFRSPHLDTPSSRYGFLKFKFISEKNKEKHLKLKSLHAPSSLHPLRLTAGPHRSMGPIVTGIEEEQRRLTSESLSMARSPTTRSPPTCSPSPCASTRALVGSTDQRSYLIGDHGGTAEVLGGGFVVSVDDVARRAGLRRQEVLAEL